MRFSINLATSPYQDAGRFYRRWLLALALVTAISAVLVSTAVTSWRLSRESGTRIRQEKQLLAQLEADRKKDEELLTRPENLDVRQRSAFLNDLIQRKAFSWTQAFADLERLMPPRLHVISMRPELTADNQLAIRMTIGADSRDRALELVRRLEQSKTFRMPEVQSGILSTQPPDVVTFEISALYVAAQPAASGPAPETQAKAEGPPEGDK